MEEGHPRVHLFKAPCAMDLPAYPDVPDDFEAGNAAAYRDRRGLQGTRRSEKPDCESGGAETKSPATSTWSPVLWKAHVEDQVGLRGMRHVCVNKESAPGGLGKGPVHHEGGAQRDRVQMQC